MAQILGVIAIIALSVTLTLTIYTIWTERPSADQFLDLTSLLLSWQIIAGAVAMAFHQEIKARLKKGT
jgi:hypothetical protein